MASNKERIEALETGLGGVQDGLQQMELGMADKFNHLEATIQKLSETLLSSNASSSHNNREREIPSRSHREEVEGYNPLTSTKTCDAPKPGGPLTTRQPAEYKWRSGYLTPLKKIGQSLLCTGSSTQLQNLHLPVPNSTIYAIYIQYGHLGP